MTQQLPPGAFVVVIPARYQSARLPGKPLSDIAGKPMLLHVVDRARESGATEVIVATDDHRIESVCQTAGVQVCMTDPHHNSGTDRITEVVTRMGYAPDTIVVNVQGDEPLIPAEAIDQVAANLAARPEIGICTLYAQIHDEAEFRNPNAVKLVHDEAGRVLYFSRAPIPFPREGVAAESLQHAKRHIGLYAYRVQVLKQFVTWAPTALEEIEKLEQLRAMAHGVSIHAEAACKPMPPGIDTPEDLEHVRRLLQG